MGRTTMQTSNEDQDHLWCSCGECQTDRSIYPSSRINPDPRPRVDESVAALLLEALEHLREHRSDYHHVHPRDLETRIEQLLGLS